MFKRYTLSIIVALCSSMSSHAFADYQAFLLETNGVQIRVASTGAPNEVSNFATGDPYATVTDIEQGRVTIYSGTSLTPIQTIYGSGAQRHFGADLSGLGDINADGISDLLVGAPGKQGTGTNCTSGAIKGEVIAFSGQSPFSPLYTFIPPLDVTFGYGDTNNGFGGNLLRLGAPGNTASPILATGVPMFYARDGAGHINYCVGPSHPGGWVISAGASPTSTVVYANEARFTKAFLGDFFGSGQQIYAIGGADVQTISFFRLDTNVLVTTLTLPSTQGARAMMTVSDYNGDGYRDLMVTHSSPDGFPTVEIYRGGPTSSLTSLHAVTATSNRSFGSALLEIPDVDGDGKPDLAMFNAYVLGKRNNVAIVSSAHFNAEGDFIAEYLPNILTAWDYFTANSALRAFGDLDGDSKSDFALTTANQVYLFLSHTTGGIRPYDTAASWYKIGNVTVPL